MSKRWKQDKGADVAPQTDAIDAKSDVPQAARKADFPDADDIRVTADLSYESSLDVLDKDPDLEYRWFRKENVRSAEDKGYRANPPDVHGRPAKSSGPVTDLVMMACRKELKKKRDRMKRRRSDDMVDTAIRRHASDSTGGVRGVHTTSESSVRVEKGSLRENGR